MLPAELICPLCKGPLLLQVALSFYYCSGCSGEYWPQEEEEITGDQLWRSEQSYKKSITTPGSGSSSGRKRKKPKKYPPGAAAARYKLY